MLQAIRDRAMGVLGWVVIGLIIVTFALFGLGSYLQDQSRAYAAKVNDVEIPLGAVQVAYQNQRARLEQMLGDAFDPAMIDEKQLKQRALDGLIQRELILQAAEAGNLAISDQLLAANIHAMPVFQEDGRFQEERYQTLLARQGTSAAAFEHDTRRLMIVEQMINGVSNTAFATRAEIERAYRLQEQKRSFSYLLVAAAPYENSVEISDEAIQGYYTENSDQFITPERVRLAYLRLNTDSIGDNIEIDDAAVLALYEERKMALKTKEKRRASHILLQLPADADQAAVDSAKAEVDALLQQIGEGADFAELAKQHSDDPGSADKGGDLGYFASGAMVPEFDEAVFAMSVGDVSDPVRSQFGFHIIKLTDIKAGEMPALDEVRADLLDELKQREIDDLYYEQLDILTNSVYENADNLDAAADELQLEVQTTDWMTADSGTGIGQYPEVRAAAFSDDVLEGGNNSEPLEIDARDAIVVRVVEREAAHATPLEEVREDIVATLRQQRATQLADEQSQQLLEKLDAGTAIETLATEAGPVLHEAEAVGRNAPGHSPELVRQVFKMSRPESGAGINRKIALSNGDHVVVQLTAVKDADPAAMTDAQRTQLQRGFENLRRNQALALLVDNLRSQAEVIIPAESE